MLGVVYLILNIMLGKEIIGKLLNPGKRSVKSGINHIWVIFPASFGVGALLMSWAVYLVSWVVSVCAGGDNPLIIGNLLVMGGTAAFLVSLYIRRKKQKRMFFNMDELVSDRKLFQKEKVFFGLLSIFVIWMMFYTFQMSNGNLYAGFTVFSDYAPHTAMIRSFSWGNNFPTQYPHFGGEDVKYHFMFQFLAGNLEYLGMRIDFAYNSISILALLGFFMMLYMLYQRIAGGFAGGILTVLFMVFRSGISFFRFAWEHIKAGDLWKTLSENTNFIGYTEHENWGLWNFNTYLNQRHLAFGLILVALALWVFMDWLEKGTSHKEKGLVWVRDRLFSKEGWKSRNLKAALLVGVFLGLSSFWNGAAVIGGLLILMGFAFFSDGKLDYAVTAAVTIGLSLIQSKFFIYGEAVEPSFYFGFLAEKKTIAGVLWYLFQLSGFFFLGLVILIFFLKRRERTIAVSFLIPTVFAFLVSLTPDVTVNHKYIMISYVFLAVFWAWAVTEIFRRKLYGKVIALIMAVCLTATGIYDFVVIIKDNDSGHRISVNMESGLSQWLRDNLKKNDLMLSPEYAMNEVTMSGAMLYFGWPYYAWSAGYATDYRAHKAIEIYSTGDAEVLKRVVAEEGITYILYEQDMLFEDNACREDVIAEAYPMVYCSANGRIRIYKTGSSLG